jgi:hypothetical protein
MMRDLKHMQVVEAAMDAAQGRQKAALRSMRINFPKIMGKSPSAMLGPLRRLWSLWWTRRPSGFLIPRRRRGSVSELRRVPAAVLEERLSASQVAKSPTVAEEAARLLADGTILVGLVDSQIKRLVVTELLDEGSGRSDAFIDGAFKGLAGGDVQMVRAHRAERKRRLAVLEAASRQKGYNERDQQIA